VDITLLLHGLLFLMIITALIAMETSNLLSSIISMGGLGFLLSIAYLLLGAPEIAITQIVVEILVLIVLIRATISRDLTAITGDREFTGLLFALGLIVVFALVGLRIAGHFPPFGQPVLDRIADVPSQQYLELAREKTGSSNVMESILLDFRAYDTLGVITVLFTAIVGALALLRRKGRKALDKPDLDIDCYEVSGGKAGMSIIVKTVTRWIKGFLMLFGMYLILNGHVSPGGGYTGGLIIACALILTILAESQQHVSVRSKVAASALASIGALTLLGLAVFDQTAAGAFFKDFIARQSAKYPAFFIIGTTQVSEIAIGCMVSSALFLVFSMLASLHVRVRDGQRDLINRKRG